MHAPQHLTRTAAAALLALAVLALHALLLGARWTQPLAVAPAATDAVQLIALAPPAARPAVAAGVQRAAAAPRPRAADPLRSGAALSSAQPKAPAAAARAFGERVASQAAAPAPAAPEAGVDAHVDTGAHTGAAMAAVPPPVYATRLPESASLHYRLQRGEAVGSARLQWQREGGAYWLRLDTIWPDQPAAGSASRGLIDADGVAPLRHSEIRRARELRAANFQRDIARITFSGPRLSYALPAGAQDRLSWMVQLGAIVAADGALRQAGAEVTLFVVGTRGDAEPWRFEVLGTEPLALPAGAVAQALHLQREPARPYDTRVEVWLDPARQHLPVRALLTTLPGGAPLRMELAPPPEAELENGAAAPR